MARKTPVEVPLIRVLPKAKEVLSGLNQALKALQLDRQSRRLSPRTVAYYRDWVTRFLHWLADEHPDCTTVSAIDANHIREHLLSLEQTGLAPASQHAAPGRSRCDVSLSVLRREAADTKKPLDSRRWIGA